MTLKYKPPSKGIEAKCDVQVVRIGQQGRGSAVVMLTELPGNLGVSITNSFEYIASQVLEQYKLSPFRTIWIEHYPERPHAKESFDLVTLEWNFGGRSWAPVRWAAAYPEWQRISRTLVLELLVDPETVPFKEEDL